MKFAICNEFCQGWDLSRVFKLASRIGYDGIEIAPFTLADSVTNISKEKKEEIKKLSKNYGVEIAGFHWLLVGPKGLSVNHPDIKIRQKTIDYFISLIDCCADLGGTTMVIGSPKQRNILEGETFEATWIRTKEFFLECLPLAEKRGVLLLIEPLSTFETNFINTAEQAIKLIKEINSPNFRLVLDVKAMSSGERPIPEIVIRAKEYLRHVHVNDADGRGPGFGSTDLKPLSIALKKIEYDKYLSVEVFDFEPDPVTIASKSYAYLKSIFE